MVTENGTQYAYRICTKVQEGIRSNDLTDIQKEYLSKLYKEFAGNEFSVDDMVRLLQTCGASAHFHLSNFTERGILNQLKHPGKASLYIFAITSEDHPECFIQISGPLEPSEKENSKSEMAMTLASTADLTASA